MSALLLAVMGLVLIFGFVVFFGAPYLPTLKKQTEEALDMLALQPGQTLLELGAGDGRVMRAAARRGLRVTGIELNPLLCAVAYLVTWRYRKQVTIICGDMWHATWPPADGIFVFLLDKYMPKLDKKIIQEFSVPVKVMSYTFKIPGRRPVGERGPLMLYVYGGEVVSGGKRVGAGRSATDAVA